MKEVLSFLSSEQLRFWLLVLISVVSVGGLIAGDTMNNKQDYFGPTLFYRENAFPVIKTTFKISGSLFADCRIHSKSPVKVYLQSDGTTAQLIIKKGRVSYKDEEYEQGKIFLSEAQEVFNINGEFFKLLQ